MSINGIETKTAAASCTAVGRTNPTVLFSIYNLSDKALRLYNFLLHLNRTAIELAHCETHFKIFQHIRRFAYLETSHGLP